MNAGFRRGKSLYVGILCGVLVLFAGCKNSQPKPSSGAGQTGASAMAQQNPPSDQQLAKQIQSRIAAQSALDGQNISVNVQNAVATLSGSAANQASRALAAAEAGSVDGVKTVITNLTVASASKQPERRSRTERSALSRRAVHHAAAARAAAPPPPLPPAPIVRKPEQVRMISPAPPKPPAPVVRTVTLPAGTVVPVRITDALDSATTQTNTTFHGSLATDLDADGMVAIPQGAAVTGNVVVAKDATHFSGNSELAIELVNIDAAGRKIAVATDTYTKVGKGRGKNTALKSGGGAVLGAVIGALAGGGKGAAIGAIAGGGAGAGANAITRGQQVKIDSESLINFRLQSPITITTSVAAGSSSTNNGSSYPQLQQP